MGATSSLTSELPVPLRIDGNTDFTPDVWATAMLYLIGRIAAIESFEPTYQSAIDYLNQYGLERLNDVLIPLYNQVSSIGSLGAIFSCESNTLNTIAMGNTTFVISNAAQQSTFAFSAYMVATSTDDSRAVGGLVTSYDRTTGFLTINVTETYGTGENSSWLISPSSPPLLSAAVVDGGDIDLGGPSATSLPYAYSGPQPVITSAAAPVTLSQFKRAMGAANIITVNTYLENNFEITDAQTIEWQNGSVVLTGGTTWTMVASALNYSSTQMATLMASALQIPN